MRSGFEPGRYIVAVRKRGLFAAGLVAATGIAGVTVFMGLSVLMAPGSARAAVEHVCGPGDKAFISSTQVDMGALELWGQEYAQGDVDGATVIAQAKASAARIRDTVPQDPTLLTTRAVLVSMFTEYAKAVKAKEGGLNAGPSMARAYTLANTAHELLADNRAALKRHGCDPAPLL
jgi:hypothetical protein